jgi:hypothetical protein
MFCAVVVVCAMFFPALMMLCAMLEGSMTAHCALALPAKSRQRAMMVNTLVFISLLMLM